MICNSWYNKRLFCLGILVLVLINHRHLIWSRIRARFELSSCSCSVSEMFDDLFVIHHHLAGQHESGHNSRINVIRFPIRFQNKSCVGKMSSIVKKTSNDCEHAVSIDTRGNFTTRGLNEKCKTVRFCYYSEYNVRYITHG